jgi:hypothetical protein
LSKPLEVLGCVNRKPQSTIVARLGETAHMVVLWSAIEVSGHVLALVSIHLRMRAAKGRSAQQLEGDAVWKPARLKVGDQGGVVSPGGQTPQQQLRVYEWAVPIDSKEAVHVMMLRTI